MTRSRLDKWLLTAKLPSQRSLAMFLGEFCNRLTLITYTSRVHTRIFTDICDLNLSVSLLQKRIYGMWRGVQGEDKGHVVLWSLTMIHIIFWGSTKMKSPTNHPHETFCFVTDCEWECEATNFDNLWQSSRCLLLTIRRIRENPRQSAIIIW